jgi:hypothetical protein
MGDYCDGIGFPEFARPRVIAGCTVLLLAFVQAAAAQQLPPPSTAPGAGVVSSPGPGVPAPNPVQDEPAPVRAAPSEATGTLGSIQKFFEDGAANFRQHLQGAKNKFDELGDTAEANRKSMDERAAAVGRDAKSAVESMTKLPASRVAQGRERCEVASNGAPDCQTAADNLCRKQGFAGGKSLDFTSAEECPARVFLSGRQTGGECKTVTFISRAMCQ